MLLHITDTDKAGSPPPSNQQHVRYSNPRQRLHRPRRSRRRYRGHPLLPPAPRRARPPVLPRPPPLLPSSRGSSRTFSHASIRVSPAVPSAVPSGAPSQSPPAAAADPLVGSPSSPPLPPARPPPRHQHPPNPIQVYAAPPPPFRWPVPRHWRNPPPFLSSPAPRCGTPYRDPQLPAEPLNEYL
ncbi:hypothetical protein VC83_04456 [Pseudogymnoascus destructans]|uniref:Uncharacterized protein n=1 Tax=Pseudogymnoascus destructans TaxID=655981 RepID=A0A177ABE4_9PEZI|nr:uncharacterized protein VC83_04456 [Pseudogymnoascus destructans]OAF59417.1 hypothetical protein VC83_04456 [Pseudogymnoascus destructans]